jgi:hypothetical protein
MRRCSIFAQILHGLADTVAGARVRQHQRKLRRLEQRPRLGRLVAVLGGLGAIGLAGRELRARFGDAVIVLELVGHLQRAAGLTFRILGQRNGRRAVGGGGKSPLRLACRRADMRGTVTGDLEMTFIGALGRLLARRDLGHAAADHDIDGAAARAHQKRAA